MTGPTAATDRTEVVQRLSPLDRYPDAAQQTVSR
jgi:hypothetical protein